jgi:type I restriction enzyme S subunit
MKKGWPTKRLGEVCQFRGGGTPSKAVERYWLGDIPWVSPKDMKFDVVSDSIDHISQEAIDGSATSLIPKDSVLMVVRSGILARIVPIAITGRELTINQDLKALCPNGAMDARFLYHLLDSKMELLLSMVSRGATVHRLMTDQIRDIDFVLPPLAEQQRIVGLLDEAFEGLATAKANAEKNLQNARALFESHLQSIFTQRGPGWKATTLGAEIDLLAGFAFKSAQYTNDDDDIRLLRGDNIIQGCLRWDDVKRWPANDTGDYERYQLEEGDVVLAMDRPWVKAGLKHATISADDLPCLLVQRTARLRGGANLDNRFLKLLIGSSAFTGHILGVQTGIGVPHISGQQIKDFEFARPPLAEQRRIADNLESLHEETQRLARLYERKHAALEALKKSLLHQAFTGELLP